MNKLRLQLLSSGGVPVTPVVSPREFHPQDRMRLMLKRGGLFLGLALLSVFIPVFHFVLVPLFLFLSVWMGLQARKVRAEIPPFEAPCPKCSKPVEFQKMYLEQELRSFCPHCRDQLKLVLSSEAAH